MRTGIYVYANSTFAIQTNEDNLQLEPMSTGSALPLTRSNRVSTPPGVFRVISGEAVTVTPEAGSNIEVVALGDKDKWPDPPLALVEMTGVTAETLGAFFPLGKSFSF
jgi:hypothetical protein